MTKSGAFVGLLAVFALGSAAAGQSMNIDFSTLDGTPSDGYAAAIAENSGAWNGVVGVTAGGMVSSLVDINGDLTGVSFLASSTAGGFSGTWNNGPQPVGDTLALLGDLLNVGGTGASVTLNFSGLADGTYNIALYAFAGDNSVGDWRTGVNVNGLGQQSIGGVYTGAYVAGVTHALYEEVEVVGGTLSVTASTLTGFGSFNGMQLQLIPAPGALALLGLAGLAGRRRRADG